MCTLSMGDEFSLEIWQAEQSDSNSILEQANLERVKTRLNLLVEFLRQNSLFDTALN